LDPTTKTAKTTKRSGMITEACARPGALVVLAVLVSGLSASGAY
jgi:hypothetical protein